MKKHIQWIGGLSAIVAIVLLFVMIWNPSWTLFKIELTLILFIFVLAFMERVLKRGEDEKED